MKNYKQTKNGVTITHKAWAREVVLQDATTGEELGRESFSDAIQARMAASTL